MQQTYFIRSHGSPLYASRISDRGTMCPTVAVLCISSSCRLFSSCPKAEDEGTGWNHVSVICPLPVTEMARTEGRTIDAQHGGVSLISTRLPPPRLGIDGGHKMLGASGLEYPFTTLFDEATDDGPGLPSYRSRDRSACARPRITSSFGRGLFERQKHCCTNWSLTSINTDVLEFL